MLYTVDLLSLREYTMYLVSYSPRVRPQSGPQCTNRAPPKKNSRSKKLKISIPVGPTPQEHAWRRLRTFGRLHCQLQGHSRLPIVSCRVLVPRYASHSLMLSFLAYITASLPGNFEAKRLQRPYASSTQSTMLFVTIALLAGTFGTSATASNPPALVLCEAPMTNVADQTWILPAIGVRGFDCSSKTHATERLVY